MDHNKPIQVDLIIIGGGIVGLWALNQLSKLGYQCVLIEKNQLGCSQSGYSQGIIHGGIKYSLTGSLTKATTSIKDMPSLWQQCLQGQGPIDLTSVKVLSSAHYLWSPQTITGKIAQFLARKSLQGETSLLSPPDYPPIFQHQQFKGSLVAVKETVLDVPSLLQQLAIPHQSRIIQGHATIKDHMVEVAHNQLYKFVGKKIILTAGAGNEALCANLPDAPSMQRRPLHMVTIKLPQLTPTFAHCLGANQLPRLTITSHQQSSGEWIWYLGGQLAEMGIARDQAQQLQTAREELQQLFPWFNWQQATGDSFLIDRAEIKQASGKRPDLPFVGKAGHCIVSWPTKLAFTPLAVEEIIKQLELENIKPSSENNLPSFPYPGVLTPSWEHL